MLTLTTTVQCSVFKLYPPHPFPGGLWVALAADEEHMERQQDAIAEEDREEIDLDDEEV